MWSMANPALTEHVFHTPAPIEAAFDMADTMQTKAFKIDMESIAECTHLTKYFGPYNITKTNENKFIFTKGTESAVLSKNGW